MTPERWRAVRAVFESAIVLPAALRPAHIDALAAGDEDLRAQVSSLLAAHEAAERGFLETPAIAQTQEPTSRESLHGLRVGPYRLLEELGRGGMGEVYRATRVDGAYTHDVAVKLVRVGAGSGALADRFRTERQILAGLEHPNIARLLDGGTSADGIPYLVMECVAGTPIDAYCDARGASIDARLALFLRVCDAVAYAHRHLVIHRDLKPGNILVTDDGTPKLLDFGIAKILDHPEAAQTTLFRPMTPEYASPEQIRGRPVTTATDVYSLGVVLYRLLTGQSPYRTADEGGGDLALALAIAATEPRLPSTVVARSPARLHRRLRGDLDAIVLKALRHEPAARYTSVEQFAEDLCRHLRGQPVLAAKGSRRYRAGKFLMRHRAAVAALGLVLAAVTAGVVATIREAHIAEANRARAEARFAQLHRLANSLIFELHDAIQHLPGATPVRQLIVARALEYLDALAAEEGANPALRDDLAAAYERIGDVQGVPTHDNLGNYAGALASYRKAARLREGLRAAAPGDERQQASLARDYAEIGDIQRAMGDLGGSLASYRQGRAILPANASPRTLTSAELQRLDLGFGFALASSGRLSEALEVYRQSVALAEQRVRESSGDREALRAEGLAYMRLGDGLIHQGRLDEALASYRRSRALLGPLVRADDAGSRRDLGVVEERLADALTQMGDLARALTLRKRALADDLETLRADPSNARARRDVWIDYYKLARLHADMGRLGEGIAYERKSLDLVEAQIARSPDDSIARDDAQIGYYHLGQMLRKSGQARAALASYQRSQAITVGLMRANPQDLGVDADYAEGEITIADLQLAAGRRAEALAAYRDAERRCDRLVAANPAESSWRALLATAYQRLGRYYARKAKRESGSAARRDWTLAEDWLARSLDHWKDLERKRQITADSLGEPKSVAAQLAVSRAALGQSR